VAVLLQLLTQGAPCDLEEQPCQRGEILRRCQARHRLSLAGAARLQPGQQQLPHQLAQNGVGQQHDRRFELRTGAEQQQLAVGGFRFSIARRLQQRTQPDVLLPRAQCRLALCFDWALGHRDRGEALGKLGDLAIADRAAEAPAEGASERARVRDALASRRGVQLAQEVATAEHRQRREEPSLARLLAVGAASAPVDQRPLRGQVKAAAALELRERRQQRLARQQIAGWSVLLTSEATDWDVV